MACAAAEGKRGPGDHRAATPQALQLHGPAGPPSSAAAGAAAAAAMLQLLAAYVAGALLRVRPGELLRSPAADAADGRTTSLAERCVALDRLVGLRPAAAAHADAAHGAAPSEAWDERRAAAKLLELAGKRLLVGLLPGLYLTPLLAAARAEAIVAPGPRCGWGGVWAGLEPRHGSFLPRGLQRAVCGRKTCVT
jgi:hypothetical protein